MLVLGWWRCGEKAGKKKREREPDCGACTYIPFHTARPPVRFNRALPFRVLSSPSSPRPCHYIYRMERAGGRRKLGRNRRFVIGVDGYGGETVVNAGISLFLSYVGRSFSYCFSWGLLPPDSYPFLSYRFHHRNISSFPNCALFCAPIVLVPLLPPEGIISLPRELWDQSPPP